MSIMGTIETVLRSGIYMNADIFVYLTGLNLLLFSVFSYFIKSESKFKPAWQCYSVFLFIQSCIACTLYNTAYHLKQTSTLEYILYIMILASLLMLFLFAKKTVEIIKNKTSSIYPYILVTLFLFFVGYSKTNMFYIKHILVFAAVVLFIRALLKITKFEPENKRENIILSVWTTIHLLIFILLTIKNPLFIGYNHFDFMFCKFSFLSVASFLMLGYFWAGYLKAHQAIKNIEHGIHKYLAPVAILLLVQVVGMSLVYYVTDAGNGIMKRSLVNQGRIFATGFGNIDWEKISSEDKAFSNRSFKEIRQYLSYVSGNSSDFSNPKLFVMDSIGIYDVKIKDGAHYLTDKEKDLSLYVKEAFYSGKVQFAWPIFNNGVTTYAVFIPVKEVGKKITRAVLFLDANPEYWLSTTKQRRSLSTAISSLLCLFFVLFLILRQNFSEDVAKTKLHTEELEKATAAAQKASAAKSMFLANMSHEIRTPMNAILGYSQFIMNDTTLGTKTKSQVSIIQKSGEHLLSIINNILEMSKIEAGHLTVNKSLVDMKTFVVDVKGMFEIRIKDKSVNFEVAVDNVPQFLEIDEDKFRQIVINLLGNALKFTQKGQIAWDLSFVLINGKHYLKFTVSDTGVGISNEAMVNIFKPFEQSDAGVRYGGTGLGLAITKKLIEYMEGTIEVSAEQGVGAAFTVKLPVEKFSEIEGVGHTVLKKKAPIGVKGDVKHLIMIVDDIEENRVVLRSMIDKIGFRSIEAANGEEAIEKNISNKPDLIFMDIKMPILDGAEATKIIRKDDRFKNLPIVAVTASAFSDDKKRILASGVNSIILKPFLEGEIFDSIEKYLNVEYAYEENVEKTIDTATLSLLSKESLTAIKESIKQVDLDNIVRIIDENKNILPHNLIEYIKKTAQNYDYGTLKSIFEKL